MGRPKSRKIRALGPYHKADRDLWAVCIRGPDLENEGRTTSQWFQFATREIAQRALEEIRAELRRKDAVLLYDAVQMYICDELRDARALERSTQAEARARLNPLIRLGPELIEDVTPEHVAERLEGLKSAASKRGTLGRMRDFFRWAVGEGLTPTDPTAGTVIKARQPRGKPTLTRSDARRLDAHLWAEAYSATPGRRAQAAALLLLLHLGIRRGELLRLQVRDLDLSSTPPIVSVERLAKTRAGLRDMAAPPTIAALLADRVEGLDPSAWLWPSPKAAAGHRGGTWLLKASRQMCAAAGVPSVTPQGLRATHAKLARRAGVTAAAVQAQLGHEDARTTRESYIGHDVDRAASLERAQAALAPRTVSVSFPMRTYKISRRVRKKKTP